MELPELQQGLQAIQQGPQKMPAGQGSPEPWLSMDNLMQGYGNWFGNDQSLGELLLGQLRAHNVDTQSATEAMLRHLLQGLVNDLNTLQERLVGFTQATAQQVQSTQNAADAIQTALVQNGSTPMAQDIQPPAAAGMPPADVPPEGAPAGAPEGAPEGAQPPADTVPPEPPANGTVSDKNVKNVKKRYVLSDASLKRLCTKAAKRMNCSGLSSNVISACQGGF